MTTPDLTTFRSRLFDCLCSRGWSFTHLSRETGISTVSISRYMKDRSPTLYNAILIADALEVSLDWLCGREDSL